MFFICAHLLFILQQVFHICNKSIFGCKLTVKLHAQTQQLTEKQFTTLLTSRLMKMMLQGDKMNETNVSNNKKMKETASKEYHIFYFMANFNFIDFNPENYIDSASKEKKKSNALNVICKI